MRATARCLPVVVLAIATASAGLESVQSQARDQTLTLDTAHHNAPAVLRLPAAPSRPPIVCLVGAGNAQDLANGLAGDGVATLRVDAASIEAESVAQWIAKLRNDERFPTVTVLAEGGSMNAAVMAARAARADGIVLHGDPGEAAAEVARLVAAKITIPPAPIDAGETRQIAEFARTVPALGRRGTTAARPPGGRRSLRHVVLAEIGSVRIGVEWGAPEKRGREIWGALVRWNDVWMPGADEATTLTTNAAIRLGTLDVPAGDHTFYTLPRADRLDLIVSNDVGQFHTVRNSGLELGRTEMTMTDRPESAEALTFAIEPKGPGATLKLIWDTREYTVALTVR